ncbi:MULTISPECIES: hypothetical protein [Desulfovibrio]|uniref:Uncharacterized protein n=2 Tax=Desulfovibrio desulfuricans TaxID=876 RepID=A0AA94HTJ8_DESDE|nr:MULTISPECIES: hypothetical protein [Desulfovibrio]ATD81175.1 translation initiation factor IF-2 [Desulfovibrio sp. G11]MDY0203617.1 translation initiation factor IF-2 [Desulfovibrio desulfuricans]SFW57133.1 hypothetical protein SAMN02910291_01895 [Desulfovibrio desulfuricans]SPD36798.1 Hypothetical protein DSVG11_2764 [Desulfovibrio sp. G11]
MNFPAISRLISFVRQHILVFAAGILIVIVAVLFYSGWRYYQFRQSSLYAYEELRDALKNAQTNNIAELVDFNALSRQLAANLMRSYPFLKAGPDQERQISDMIQTALLRQLRSKQEAAKEEPDLKTRLKTPLYALPSDFLEQLSKTISLQTASEGTALLTARIRHPLLDKNFPLILRMDKTAEGWIVRSLVNGPELTRQFREAQVERMRGQRQMIVDKNAQTERRIRDLFPLQSCSADAGLISDGSTLLVVVRVLARDIGTVGVNNMNLFAEISDASGSNLLSRNLNAVQPVRPGEDFKRSWTIELDGRSELGRRLLQGLPLKCTAAWKTLGLDNGEVLHISDTPEPIEEFQ